LCLWQAHKTITQALGAQPGNIVTMREKEEAPQIRCGNCNRLLGKGTALDLSIKCPRCGCMNHVKEHKPERATLIKAS
jgi:phage FluMu protein Com